MSSRSLVSSKPQHPSSPPPDAKGRAGSQRRRIRPVVLVVADGEADLDVIARELQERFELRFRDTLEAACVEIDQQMPDVLMLDEDLDRHRGRELLARLADDLRSPVVVVLSHDDEPPMLSRLFGVPSVKKPIDPARVVAALDVARDKRLRPVRRSANEE